jgi:hypothetical protein
MEHMSRPSVRTTPVTFRILNEQLRALKSLPIGYTGGSLIRYLLELYISGQIKLPEVSQTDQQNAA